MYTRSVKFYYFTIAMKNFYYYFVIIKFNFFYLKWAKLKTYIFKRVRVIIIDL